MRRSTDTARVIVVPGLAVHALASSPVGLKRGGRPHPTGVMSCRGYVLSV